MSSPIETGADAPRTSLLSTARLESLWHLLLLLILSALWGGTFLLIKLAVEIYHPFVVSWGRISLAAVLLLLFTFARGDRLPRSWHSWGVIALVAVFNNAAPFTLIAFAERQIDSNVAAILMALAPFFALMLSHNMLRDERASRRKIFGIAIGFLGVLIIFGADSWQNLGVNFPAQAAVALAAACYPLSAIIMRRLKETIASSMIAALSLSAGTVLLLPAFLLNLPEQVVFHVTATTGLILLGVFGTAFAQLIRFYLLQKTTVTFVGLSGYIVPLFGVMWGAGVLGEEIPPFYAAALVAVLAGVFIGRFSSGSSSK